MSEQIQKCPPRFLISFPEIKAKKAFLKGKAIPDNPQQIAWPELCPATGEIRGSSMCIISLQPTPESRGVVQLLWGQKLCPSTHILSEKQ